MRALIVSSDRFEDSELSRPLQHLRTKGVEVDIAAPQRGPITGKHGHRVTAGLALSTVRADDYDLLLLPGGEAPATLRKIPEAVAIVRHFLQANKPVAAICHGPQLLIATGLVAGRTATCYRAVRQELEAAGVNYRDREVVVDGNLVTLRQPADIPAFMRAIFRITGLSR
jgi:archaeal arginyl aminopeptidase